MRFCFVSICCIVFGLLISVSSIHADDGIDFFEKEVRPILVKRCYACHSGTKQGGGLSLESAEGWKKGGESGPTIIPGKPEESLLLNAINYRSLEMPPQDQGGKLPAAEIAVLTKWISIGAPDPRIAGVSIGGMSLEEATAWWAFQPLPQTDPAPSDGGQIDQYLQRKLDEHGLQASAPADRRTLIRRATYDLTGLPPTPEEVEEFLDDDGQDAFAKVVDRLLASPQYGIHWGRHWLDVVRYADTAGENTDRPLPHAWRYRNWVFDSLNRDIPYDDFVRLQLSGDIINSGESPIDRTEGIIATGYLAIARRFGHDIDKDIHLMHEDVIDNLGKNLLGLTLGCARCHDHKYDPVTSEDYYALYGIFDSTRFAFPGCEPKGQPRDLVPLMEQAEVDALMSDYQRILADYEKETDAVVQLSQKLQQLVDDSRHLLAESKVEEGQSVSLHEDREGRLDRVSLRKGEVLQLTVLPNTSHGADTTRVELEISRLDDEQQKWDTDDLIATFTAGGPAIQDRGATWCLLDVADGPLFLHEKKQNINGQTSLSAWAIGDTPSSVVNASENPVAVWTTLPGHAFFIHPGHQRNVAVAWVCPADGDYQVRGVVTDAHPAPGLDGVAFRLEHLAVPEFGTGLISLAKLTMAEKPPRPEPPVIPVAYAVVDAAARNAHMHLRGDPEQLGKEIPRHWLSVFGSTPLADAGNSGRRQLAELIVEHPLFARVMVNRVWEWHFGRGLVATPNDFGSRGERPTHPEMLDWLAARFRAEGYQLKPLHRLIMTSAAYQRSAHADDRRQMIDSDNLWLSRFSRRRLTAEEIRDSLLTVSGRLDTTFGEAHPFPPEADWRYTQHDPFNAVYDTNRRSAFLMVQRQRRHPYLALFDGADPNASTPIRQETTVPTQALYFLNDPFFHERAAELAALAIQQPDDATRIHYFFRRLYQREPTAAEIEIAERFLSQYRAEPAEKYAAYARVLLASNEFLYVD